MDQLHYVFQRAKSQEAHTILLLHGTGGSEYDLLTLGKQIAPTAHLLGLRGNSPENGRPRFFKRLAEGIFDEEDIIERTNEMVQFVRELAAKENFLPNRIVALGFSNGANIAGSTLALHPDFLLGGILLRPMAPFKSPSQYAKPKEAKKLLMGFGKHDPLLAEADARKYVEFLKQTGFSVEAYSLDTGHGLSNEDITFSEEWYAENFS